MLKNNLIERHDCINSITPFIDIKMIKIISGVRRCGKSYLLNMLGDTLIERGIPSENIIYRLYTSIEVEDDFSAKDMFNEIKEKIIKGKRYYLLLDEVQEINNWEKCINTLYETFDVDIYVTGSNSKLTGEKISSYLSGRYILIPQYTLSFSEYATFTRQEEKDQDYLYGEYARTGGFPIIAANHIVGTQVYQMVDDIYHSVIARDVLSNHPIHDMEKFNRVVKFVVENVGKTFSAKSISDYMKSQNRNISVETIYNYLEWLEEAFIIYRCNRYDIQGKEILKTQEKYYLSDIAFKFALFGYSHSMDDAILENILYLELRRRGYQVYIGKNKTKEIDFVAKKHDEEIDIQATVQIPKDSNREIGNLESIDNHCHKYIVTTNRNDCETVNGIQIIHVTDFLKMKNW